MKKSRMQSISCSFLFIILFSFSGTLISQDAATILDRVYGLDQTLINGKKYNFLPPFGTKRDQFLFSPVYIAGSVTLKGKGYQDIELNYDIFNQQLLLKYVDEAGGRNSIEVSKAWLTNFSLGNMNFEFLHLEQEPHFYQVLGERPVQILYYWRKNLDLDVVVGSYNYIFTRAVRDSYVFMDGQLKPFRSKRSLVRLFNPRYRQEIKSYLRKNKVNVKKASDKAMAEMITFIRNIR
ncbi:MAG: hypothetical protein ABIJ04_09900 [Bacteroidota bacterium]